MACSSGCVTKDHASYGECLQSKSLGLIGHDVTKQRKWDQELVTYRDARSAGLQPRSTKMADSRAALASNG